MLGSKSAVSILSLSFPSHTWPLTSDLVGLRKHQHRMLRLLYMPTAWRKTHPHTQTNGMKMCMCMKRRFFLSRTGQMTTEREGKKGKGREVRSKQGKGEGEGRVPHRGKEVSKQMLKGELTEFRWRRDASYCSRTLWGNITSSWRTKSTKTDTF